MKPIRTDVSWKKLFFFRLAQIIQSILPITYSSSYQVSALSRPPLRPRPPPPPLSQTRNKNEHERHAHHLPDHHHDHRRPHSHHDLEHHDPSTDECPWLGERIPEPIGIGAHATQLPAGHRSTGDTRPNDRREVIGRHVHVERSTTAATVGHAPPLQMSIRQFGNVEQRTPAPTPRNGFL